MTCSCFTGAYRGKSLMMSIFSKATAGNLVTLMPGRMNLKNKLLVQGLSTFSKNYNSFSSRVATLSCKNYSNPVPALNSCFKSTFQRGHVLQKNNISPRVMIRRTNSSGNSKSYKEKRRSTAMYIISVAILVGGGSYAAVPLYRLYCQTSGYGGTVRVADVGEKIEKMEKQTHRVIKVKFNADTGATMRWSFKPQQTEIKIVPGETALAFYTAKNPTGSPITGVSTYNVLPYDAGQYFNKIQCFCFEEQRLNPGEEVDMPVFFYIDPEYVLDPNLAKVNEITLSYTFFEAKEISWPDLQNYRK